MILLVGAGPMAQDYAKVFDAMSRKYVVVGRSADSAQAFEYATGHSVICGGLDAYLRQASSPCKEAVVSVGVEALAVTTLALLEHGFKRILVEKPAGLDLAEIEHVCNSAKQRGAEVFVAYNRRFYSSVKKAQQIIAEDGGVDSFNFELTEWGHVIANVRKAPGVKENWFLANTSHVADLAFFLGGEPEQLQSFSGGHCGWHSRSSNFAGAGRSKEGALFCYNGNWNSPGRWSVEVLTRHHRLILRPIEQLYIQSVGSVKQELVEIDDTLDKAFKPGLYVQLTAFLNGDDSQLCSIEHQLQMGAYYCQIAGYSN